MIEFLNIDMRAIVESTFNPRKNFDGKKLAELTESIKTSGVLQPILVRPLTGDRVADTDRTVEFEIIAGARRFRACELAGLKSIPAIVRVMDTNTAMEVAILENLQRDDLTELEEAEGYETLMQHAHISADQVGERIGKSRSYVYGRIKLLDLCTETRASLRNGTIDASRALLVARIPDHKLQIKAMMEVVQGRGYAGYDKEPMSYRQALAHVQQNYMLKLGEAKFAITRIDLVPAAGSCKTCTKRTGNDPELFSDVKGADVCTDPPCFHKKEEAHALELVKAAQDKGQNVIAGKEAAELASGPGYSSKFKGYRRLDSAEDSPTNQPLRKIIGKQMVADGIKPTLIESTKGELVACLPNHIVLRLLNTVEGQAQAAKVVSKEVREFADEKKAKAEAKAKAQYEREWRDTLVQDTWVALRDHNGQDNDIKVFGTQVHRYLAVRAANNLNTDPAAAICKLLNLGKVSPIRAVVEFAKETASPDMLHLLIIMQEASGTETHTYGGRIPNEGLLLVAGNVFGKQLDDVIKEIKAEVKAKIWPKITKKPNPATAPAARPEVGAGGAKDKVPASKKSPARAAKLSAEEATLGIAAAMQGIDGAASADAVALPAEPAGAGDDALFESAVAIIVREQKANVRLLKTELKVGTTKALNLMDMLQQAGKVSACDERGARKVLVAA